MILKEIYWGLMAIFVVSVIVYVGMVAVDETEMVCMDRCDSEDLIGVNLSTPVVVVFVMVFLVGYMIWSWFRPVDEDL